MTSPGRYRSLDGQPEAVTSGMTPKEKRESPGDRDKHRRPQELRRDIYWLCWGMWVVSRGWGDGTASSSLLLEHKMWSKEQAEVHQKIMILTCNADKYLFNGRQCGGWVDESCIAGNTFGVPSQPTSEEHLLSLEGARAARLGASTPRAIDSHMTLAGPMKYSLLDGWPEMQSVPRGQFTGNVQIQSPPVCKEREKRQTCKSKWIPSHLVSLRVLQFLIKVNWGALISSPFYLRFLYFHPKDPNYDTCILLNWFLFLSFQGEYFFVPNTIQNKSLWSIPQTMISTLLFIIISLMGRLFKWPEISLKRNKSVLCLMVLKQTWTFQVR